MHFGNLPGIKHTAFHQKLLFFEEIWQNGCYSENIQENCYPEHGMNFLCDVFAATFMTSGSSVLIEQFFKIKSIAKFNCFLFFLLTFEFLSCCCKLLLISNRAWPERTNETERLEERKTYSCSHFVHWDLGFYFWAVFNHFGGF